MINRVFVTVLLLVICNCSCEEVINGSKDAGVDTGILCGNGYYPSFDYQCRGNVGCREINKGLCICRCVMCEDERCVGMSCGGIGCEGDGGVGDFGIEDLGISDLGDAGNDIGGEEIKDVYVDDVSDVSDIKDVSDIRDAGDVGIDDFEYVCKDPGDPVGVDFWGNLDEPIVKISDTVYMDARISGDYVVWLEYGSSGMRGKDIYYLNLRDKRVRRVPNCDRYEKIYFAIEVEGTKVYWMNAANACSLGGRCDVIFEFDMETRTLPRIVSLRDGAYFPEVYKNHMVYEILGNYGPEKLGLYYTDLLIGYTKKISDKYHILLDYRTTFWEREIIIAETYGIKGINIDTLEEKIHYKTDLHIESGPHYDRYPYVTFFAYLPKEKYGHYTTDLFILDIRDDSVIQATDDEQLQFV